tara:strand:+ start:409 stop:1719 length:1311 start_codon:yes stop_codon:yes gene_type:complete
MIELLGIFLSLLVFIGFSLFPFQVRYCENVLFKKEYCLYDVFFLNLLINFFILFLISFTKINIFYYFVIILSCSILTNIFFLTKNKKNFTKYININLLFFIIFNLTIYFYIAKDPTLSWDGQNNWFYKAQNFFYDYNFFDLIEIREANYYPHFGTLLWGFFWKNSLLQFEYSGRLIYIFIFLVSIFSICDLLNKKSHIKVLIYSALILVCFDSFLFKGYQEVLIFSFLIFVSKNFYYYILSQKKLFLIICFLCLNFLPWIKNEGYLYPIIFNLSLLFTIKYFPKKFEILLFIFLSAILLIIKNLIFYKYMSINLLHGGNLDLFLSLQDLKEFISSMLVGSVVAIFKYKIWFFILASIFLFYKRKNIKNKDIILIKFLNINLFLFILLVFGIYFSVMHHSYGLKWWIDNSLDRILYQISGLLIILIIVKTNYLKIRF